MLYPALADVLEAAVLEAVEVLGDDRVLVGVADPVRLACSQVAGCGAHGEGCDATQGAVYPWLLIGLVRNHLTRLPERDESFGYWFQKLVSILLAWVATPATIALFAVPSFSRSAFRVSYLIAVVFGLCAGVALFSWRDADQSLRGEHREH